jgi:hypothetical protein
VKVTDYHTSDRRHMPNGGTWLPAYITVQASDGTLYFASFNADSPGNSITLRKAKP